MKKAILILLLVSVAFCARPGGHWSVLELDDSLTANIITVDSVMNYSPPFGRIDRSTEDGDTLTCATADTFYVIPVADSACCMSGNNKIIYCNADRSLTIPPGWSGTYFMSIAMSMSCDATSIVHLAWSKNDAVGDHAKAHNKVKHAVEEFNMSMHNIADNVTAGDVFKLEVSTDNAGDKVVINHAILTMFWLCP